MGFYQFKKDKLLGDEAENKILNILHDSGYPLAYRVQGKEAKWDIIIPEINKKIEVKNDLLAVQTGNLAIEMFKKNGDASGIMVSEADWWVIFASEEIYLLDRVKLKEYCNIADHHVVMGGDNWGTQMMLIPIDIIKQQKFFRKLE